MQASADYTFYLQWTWRTKKLHTKQSKLTFADLYWNYFLQHSWHLRDCIHIFPPKGEISNCDRRKKKCLLSTWACRKSMADRLQTSLNGHIKDSGRWFWSMKRRWLRAVKYQWIRTVSLISFPDQACPGYARCWAVAKHLTHLKSVPRFIPAKDFMCLFCVSQLSEPQKRVFWSVQSYSSIYLAFRN